MLPKTLKNNASNKIFKRYIFGYFKYFILILEKNRKHKEFVLNHPCLHYPGKLL